MASTHPFQGKVIAITGASRGTGLALARYLLARGANVSMAATSADNLAAAVAGIERDMPDVNVGARVLTAATDITKPEEVQAWIEATVARFGPLDGAANIAAKASQRFYPIETLPVEDLREMLDVNVVGTFNCLQQELRHMRPGGGGSIVNCGSIQIKYASGLMSGYAASKHALLGLTQCAAYEAGPKGVRVNMVSPGCIDTDMIRQPYTLANGETFRMTEGEHLTSILKRWSRPDEIAATIAFLLSSEAGSITKQEWYVDNGWYESDYVSAATDAK